MTEPLIPSSDLVAVHWLRNAVAGLSSKVATTLPDATAWPDNEFVQVMDVGGSLDPELPRLTPVVTFNCFANAPDSAKPPWGQAATLAMKIWRATLIPRRNPDPAYAVDLPGDFGTVHVQSAWCVSEIRRLPSDPSQYAVYIVDVAISWIPAELVLT